jgi:hypothetical protein
MEGKAEETRKVVERARQLVWSVREGKNTTATKPSLDFAKALVMVDSDAQRFRKQVEAHRRYLRGAVDVLDEVIRHFNDDEELSPSDLNAIKDLAEDAHKLLKEKQV